MTDPLSAMLALVDAHCEIAGGFRAGGDWAFRFEADVAVKLEAVIRGSCWVTARDEPPVRLTAGDAVVLNDAGPVVFCSEPGVPPVTPDDLVDAIEDSFVRLGTGDDVIIIGGHVNLNAAAAGFFTSALPPVTHAIASSAEATEMRRLLEQIMQEQASSRPGASYAMAQHAQLLLLHVLRNGMRHDARTHPSWLRLIADPQLPSVVALMHDDPARHWRLVDLAAAAGMSRSHFAHRFRETSGQSPLNYLAHWRVRLAEQALRTSDTPIAVLADRLGYASESSFQPCLQPHLRDAPEPLPPRATDPTQDGRPNSLRLGSNASLGALGETV